jgi:hypothetical protein
MQKLVTTFALAGVLALAGTAAAAQDAGATPLGLYLKMHAALAGDSAEGVAAAAGALAENVRTAAKSAQDAAAFEKLAAAAEKMKGSEIAALREQFKEVSVAFADYVTAAGTAGAQLWYCPMADGYWAQKSADAGPLNPYYGKSMLKCGSKVDRVEG